MNDQFFIFKSISAEQHDFLLAMKAMGERRNIPNISWNTAEYLFSLLHWRNVKNVLEIGPANGFSTLILGIICPEAQIVSIECSRHAFEELRKNVSTFFQMKNYELWIKRTTINEPREQRTTCLPVRQANNEQLFLPAELWPKATSSINQEIIWSHHLYYADARELLPAFIAGTSKLVCENPKSELHNIPKLRFDAIFIDGAFRMTRDFFDLSLPLLASLPGTWWKKSLESSPLIRGDQRGVGRWWIIIIDDAIKYAWKMDGFHEYLQSINIPYELVQTDADDGVMIIDGR